MTVPQAAHLLAFDTSTERMAVALVAGGRVWTDNRDGGAAASAALLPTVRALMQQAGVSPSQLQAVAFGRGPGAFTGLRTSCAVAQGLAFGWGLPVLALDSLRLVAEQARRAAGAAAAFELGVAMDARMGEVYAGRYAHDGTRWHTRQAAALWSPEDLAQAWAAQPPAQLAGSAAALCGAALSAACGQAPWLDLEASASGAAADRASALAAVAVQAWADGETLDPALALPVYLRDKVALTTAERAAAARAAAAPAGAAG